MVQADFSHKGTTNKEFLFMGHFDHPSCVNDGLAGCIAAFEVINRLKGRKRWYCPIKYILSAGVKYHPASIIISC